LIKAHITDATQQLSGDVRHIADNNAKFKQEVKEELDEMRKVLAEQKRLLNVASPSPSPPPSVLNSTSTMGNPVLSTLNDTSGQIPSVQALTTLTAPPQAGTTDVNSQMLMMLTEFFSKLSTVLSEKSDTKSNWPKFSGDGKKFRSWYLAVMAQLSLPPWVEFYDSSKNDVILTTTNTVLNGKLYSKLLLALEGTALQSAVSKKYLRANGLSLLRDLVQMYKPKNVPEVIALKTGEFWSASKRYPNESIDTYFNRFHDILDDLSEAEEPIPLKSAICHFIFTLGPDFEAIQNNYQIGNLPDIWKTEDWPTLLVLCRDYYNSIKQQVSIKKETSGSNLGNQNSNFDRLAHQKKVRSWFMQPDRFCQEIPREQLKFPDMCLFHMSKTHQTNDCHVKKECDKLRASNLNHLRVIPPLLLLHHFRGNFVI